jgi:hypothetical protein
MKNVFVIAGILCCLFFAFSGCGGGDTAPEGAAEEAQEETGSLVDQAEEAADEAVDAAKEMAEEAEDALREAVE